MVAVRAVRLIVLENLVRDILLHTFKCRFKFLHIGLTSVEFFFGTEPSNGIQVISIGFNAKARSLYE